MELGIYQIRANKLNHCPKHVQELHAVLGLAGEVGEVCEKYKRIFRDKNGVLDFQTLIEIKKELGDVLWYLSDCCTQFGLLLEDVATENLDKLESRLQRGTIRGNGDNR